MGAVVCCLSLTCALWQVAGLAVTYEVRAGQKKDEVKTAALKEEHEKRAHELKEVRAAVQAILEALQSMEARLEAAEQHKAMWWRRSAGPVASSATLQKAQQAVGLLVHH